MKNYLLLRDNKQTGPYSFDEMVNKGFKAYDLVWVEGKSAAWRYPGELDEFKPYAPIVEEQPYDRFYRRPSQQQNKSSQEQQVNKEAASSIPKIEKVETPSFAQFVQEENIKEEKEQIAEQKESSPKKFPKYVAVTFPAAKNSAITTVKIKKAEPPVAPIEEKKKVQEQQQPLVETAKSFALGFDNPATEKKQPIVSTSSSVPVEDNNIQYRLPEKQKTSVMQIVAVAAAIISLVAVGVLIGMSFSNGTGDKKLPQQEQAATKKTPETKNTSQEQSTAANANTDVLNASLQQPADPNITKPEQSNELTGSVPASNKVSGNEVKPKKQNKAEGQKELAQAPAAQTDKPATTVATVAEKDSKQSVEAKQKEFARKNIEQLVSMNLNDYKVGMFGGISELQVTVTNGSAYPVDLVVVEVSYIQSNKKTLKTETLHFKNITANSSQVLPLPKTNKGIKINSKITYISSKDLDLSYNIW